MYKCKVCEREFELKCERHYISRDEGKTGLAAFAGGTEASIYDTFDCPHCGCQNVTQKRKRKLEEPDVEEIDVTELLNAKEELPGCYGKYDEGSIDGDCTCLLCEHAVNCRFESILPPATEEEEES